MRVKFDTFKHNNVKIMNIMALPIKMIKIYSLFSMNKRTTPNWSG